MTLVKFYGNFRKLAGGLSIEIESPTVGDALRQICAANEPLCEAIFDEGELRPYVRAMLNGHDVMLGEGLETPLVEEDTLAIFPPIAGGND